MVDGRVGELILDAGYARVYGLWASTPSPVRRLKIDAVYPGTSGWVDPILSLLADAIGEENLGRYIRACVQI